MNYIDVALANTISTSSLDFNNADTHLKVFGLHCTGTNLVTKLFNMGRQGADWWNLGMALKHTASLHDIERVLETDKNSKVVFVYRDIQTWLKSFAMNSYECRWNGKLDHKLESHPQREGQCTVTELYIRVYTMYITIAKRYPSRCAIVSYYKLLMPSSGYKYYQRKAEELGVPAISRSTFDATLAEPAKKHGHCVSGSAEALTNRNEALDSKKADFINKYYGCLLQQVESEMLQLDRRA